MKHLFAALIISYLSVFLILIGIQVFRLTRPATLSLPSRIPALSVTVLDQITSRLSARTKLDYRSDINLSDFQFGKSDPFSPKGGE